jgi:hypothetical protein
MLITQLHDETSQRPRLVVEGELLQDAVTLLSERLRNCRAHRREQAVRSLWIQQLHQRASFADMGCQGTNEFGPVCADLAAEQLFKFAILPD